MPYLIFYLDGEVIPETQAWKSFSALFPNPITAQNVWNLLALGDPGAIRCLASNTGIEVVRSPD